MAATLAFDVYGTLINPHAVIGSLQEHLGDRATGFSQVWRDKQLEYSFRRGLMGAYRDFSVVTRNALDYACAAMEVSLSDGVKDRLMAQYRELDAFDDAVPALESLRAAGCRMHAFSNGLPGDLVQLMRHAGIDALLDSIVSVHDVRSFKPDPKVYAHFNASTKSEAGETWLISSNPFDIVGAAAFGWNTAWVQRSAKAVFDPWEFSPTTTVTSLGQLKDRVT